MTNIKEITSERLHLNLLSSGRGSERSKSQVKSALASPALHKLNSDSEDEVQVDLRFKSKMPKRERHRMIRRKLQQHVEELAIESYDMAHKWDDDEYD